MNKRTQAQQESEDLRAVFHAVNEDAICYLCSDAASSANGNLAFVVEYSNEIYDEDGEFQGMDVWGNILELIPDRLGELLTGPLSDAVRRLLQRVEPLLDSETLNIYMADNANRSARAALNDVLAQLEAA